jgi:hypothetical protein
MRKLTVLFLFLSIVLFFSSASFAQDSTPNHVVHVQTFKFIDNLGDNADAFNEMLVRQSEVINGDPRVLNSYILRHNWGADSRDLVFVLEFASLVDLFAFYENMNTMFEDAFTKEQLDADNALFSKYVGEHSDEIYAVVPGTSK